MEAVETRENSPGFSRNKPLGRYGWVNADNIHRLSWAQYIQHCFQAGRARLPRKVQQQVGSV